MAVRILLTIVMLLARIDQGTLDYPPHDIQYRIHPIELFPKEATHSLYCQNLPDGNYPHNQLDLGDPRCTFVMCTNRRTVVHSCPSGTRTGRFYFAEYNPKAFHLAQKYGKYAKYAGGRANLQRMFREHFRNRKSTHGICDYFDSGGVCGALYPDYNAFVHREDDEMRRQK